MEENTNNTKTIITIIVVVVLVVAGIWMWRRNKTTVMPIDTTTKQAETKKADGTDTINKELSEIKVNGDEIDASLSEIDENLKGI